ncbi:MAG: 6-carboxytetrahydropterin synthase [Candidatus Heimdallarchaeota archaeon]|nr:6-carboxytetrahydropterin synthase [Candidatus Heimdallarchaeota archaeon]
MIIFHKFQFNAQHLLDLPYESNAKLPHYHDYQLELTIKGNLDNSGMVIEFDRLSDLISQLENSNLNTIFQSTTIENLAISITEKVLEINPKTVISITTRLWETESRFAEYTLLN